MNNDNEFIEIVRELNIELFEKYNDNENSFYYETNGMFDVIKFNDTILWYSDDDERKFSYKTNDYEPLLPFIKNQYMKFVDKLSNINFDIEKIKKDLDDNEDLKE